LNDTENQTDCLSYVRFEDEYIQVNPSREAIEQYGISDTFQSNSGLVNVFFTNQDLRDNKTVVFGVVCQDEIFERNVTPRYTDFTQTFDRMVWARNNASMLVGITIFLIIIAIGAGYVIREARNK
jgi:hypothetical protein